MKLKLLIVILASFIFLGTQAQTYNYAEALQKSLYFYDAEKCGPDVTGTPLNWRGPCHVCDAVLPLTEAMTNMSASFINTNRSILDPDWNGTLDVGGGYHDAGDHVQFGLPQTYSSSTLEWAMYEFKDAFSNSGQLDHMKDILKWASDYYLKCTYLNGSGDVVAFCYQVGEGNIDHNFWGPPELIDTKKLPRPAHFATSETPASDQCAGAAASLALTYLNNLSDDPTYANKCLTYAKALYKFAVDNRGLGYSGGFYNSSFDEDELSWAAIWLYIATNQESYLTDITSIDASGMYTGWLGKIIRSTQDQWQNIWVHSWDTKWGGVFAKLAPITNDSFHWWIFRWNLEYWSGVAIEGDGGGGSIAKTPAGFSFLNAWGSARYNAAAQFQGMVYKKYANSSVFDSWMTDQINYIMGDNPLGRSYIVGYSSNYAKHPHHRAAHGSSTNSMFDPKEHKHILWGALVGGPGANDEHVDSTSDFVYNEVAIDYNAGLVGALAGHYYYFGAGQQPVSPFPTADPALVEYKIEAKILQDDSRASQVAIRVMNESAFPPCKAVPIKARYYFNISEIMQYGLNISNIHFDVSYDENAATSQPVTANGPIAHDAANGIYYMEFVWPDSGFYGSREYQFTLYTDMDASYTFRWDASNDYSHTDLTTTYANNGKVPMYVKGVLFTGTIPGTEPPVSVTGVTVSPATLSMTVGGTSTLTATVTPTNATNKSINWSSSNTAVASVSSAGVVIAVSSGSATITCTTVDGLKTATAAITVTGTNIPVTGVTISPTSASVNVGSTTSLTATVAPTNATIKTLNWTSSNASIATISSAGVVTGVAIGTATITVTSVSGGYTASSVITVNAAPTPCENPSPITLPFTNEGAGENCFSTSGTISNVNSWNMDLVEINGTDYTNKWSSVMPARVNGMYYIHTKASVAYAHLEIAGSGGNTVSVTGVSVSPSSVSVNIGGTTTLTATVSPTNATNKSVTWSTSNSAIATVSTAGVVTGVGTGSATITVTTVDQSKTATASITVSSSSTSVTGVTVAPTTASITVGGITTLTATVTPTNATNKSVTWSSSNTAIASVSTAGIVTGVGTGSATITVKTTDQSKTATATITVTSSSVSVTGVTVSPASATVNVGSTTTLTATVTPTNATNKSVAWSSSNTAIATVSTAGVVTGVGTGSATITVTTADQSKTATAAITVTSTSTTTCGSSNAVSITIPFSKDGVGEYCYVTTQAMAYVNSWNMDKVTINDVDYTNKWSNSMPAAINGAWYIYYKASVSWAHFEVPAVKNAAGIEESMNRDVVVYPNPFDNEITIKYNGIENITRIELYNSIGQLVSKLEENEISADNTTMQIENPGNMFILRIYSNNEVIVKSIIRK